MTDRRAKAHDAAHETDYLLRNPTNARHVLGAIARLENGEGTQHDLAD